MPKILYLLLMFSVPYLSAAGSTLEPALPKDIKPESNTTNTEAKESASNQNTTIIAEKANEIHARVGTVLLTSGENFSDVWIEEKEAGSWILIKGERYWYLKSLISKIEYSKTEPSEELMAALLKSKQSQQKSEESIKKSDLERLRTVQEKAKAIEQEVAALKDATQNRSKQVSSSTSTPVTVSRETGSPESGSKKEKKASRRHRRYRGTAALLPPIATDSSGGTGGDGDTSTTGSTTSSGTGDSTTPNNTLGVHLALQWRVKWIKRKTNTIRIKNRYIKKAITLIVKDPKDLNHIRKRDILQGQLSAEKPNLLAKTGEVIEFVISTGPLVNP